MLIVSWAKIAISILVPGRLPWHLLEEWLTESSNILPVSYYSSQILFSITVIVVS